MNHRKAPLPEHFHTAPKGTCRVCNQPVIGLTKTGKPSKSRWHQECLKEYKLIHWVSVTRRAVWSRDKGKCANCGKICKRNQWDMDHVKPLIESQGDIAYWQLPNLQTLCSDCHIEKTSKENSERALRKRLLKEDLK